MWRRRGTNTKEYLVNNEIGTGSVYTMQRLIRVRINRLFGIGASPNRQRKIYVIIGGLIFLFLTYRYLLTDETDAELELSLTEEEIAKSNHNPNLKSDKWVVITTIRSPTDAIRLLAEQSDWKLVIVGDRKTPKSWSLPNVVYLNLKLQKSLGYRILQYLPYNTYARKSIGYLYAIQHGARYIYETDDDNYAAHGLSGFQSNQQVVSRLVLSTNTTTNNPYIHFGQSTLWPRGYPLDRIGLPAERRYDLCDVPTPPIQQGVVNGDPDVDALFRLTRRHYSTPLQLKFDQAAPPFVLPPRTFAPFNSQNTFFESRALWALVLPVTSVPDRAVDIYRAYWAQRLLWLIGDAIAFAPPNAVQTRNQHLDLVDARDESGMYLEMMRYIKTLDQWQCDREMTSLFDCISHLSRHLVKEGFWKSRDADIVDAWLFDLTSVGYSPPARSNKPLRRRCKFSEVGSGHVVFHPVEQNTSMPHTSRLYLPPASTNHERISNKVASMCTPAHSLHWNAALASARKIQDTLLVISVPGNIHSVLPGLEAFYRLHFPNIIYCVRNKVDDDFINRWKISVVHLPREDEVSAVPCLLAVGEMRFGVRSLLHVSSNMLLNVDTDKMAMRIDSLIWMPGEFDAYQHSTSALCHRRTIACRHMSRDVLTKTAASINLTPLLNEREKTRLRSCISKLERDPSLVGTIGALWISDLALFVPNKWLGRLSTLRVVLTAELDLMAVLMLECEQLTVNYLHRSEQFNVTQFAKRDSTVDYFLPFAFDQISNDNVLAKPFCSYLKQFK